VPIAVAARPAPARPAAPWRTDRRDGPGRLASAAKPSVDWSGWIS